MMFRHILLASLCSVVLSPMNSNAQQPTWKSVGSLNTGRAFFVVLPISATSAIVMGGWRDGLFGTPTNTCEILTTNGPNIVVSEAASMSQARAEFQGYVLGDTAVVVFSGYGDRENATSVEVYSIKTNTWRTVGHLKVGRRQHVVIPLGDDKFAIAGGRTYTTIPISSAELFDLRTGLSKFIADYPVDINGAIGTVASNGIPVVMGGRARDEDSERFPEIRTYSATTDTWETVGRLPSGREALTYTKLRDGRLVIIGGSLKESSPLFLNEVVAENNGNFALAGAIPDAPIYCGVAEYTDDVVVVAGGFDAGGQTLNVTSFFNVETGKGTVGPRMITPRKYTRAVGLEYREGGISKRTVLAIAGVSGSWPITSVEMLVVECDASANSQDLLAASTGNVLLGSAKRVGSIVRLTDTLAYVTGALWTGGRVKLEKGFSTDFTFVISHGDDNAQMDGSSPGADGVSFVIQTAGQFQAGSDGQGVGYDDMPNCIAVEFDSYFNFAYSDPNGSHCAVQTGRDKRCKGYHTAPYLLGITSNIPELKADGKPYYARVEYVPGKLKVYLSRTTQLGQPVLEIDSFYVDQIIPLGPSQSAWIGFTSATGHSWEQHDITSWTVGGCEPLVMTSVDYGQTLESPQLLKVIPSPSSDVAMLSCSSMQGDASVTITSSSGVVVYSTITTPEALREGISLPVSKFSAGMYIIFVSDGTSSTNRPWAIVR